MRLLRNFVSKPISNEFVLVGFRFLLGIVSLLMYPMV